MKEATKNMLIGLFVLGACFLIVSVILFLKPTVGDGKKILYVRFSNINKINVGSRVLFAGKPVGEVVSIEEIHNAREQPADALGQVYFFQLTLKVDSSLKVYNTDEIVLQTSGLLGEKSIAIQPKSPPIGVIPKLISSEPIYASSIDPFENTFEEISGLSNKVEATIDHLSRWMDENGTDISFAIKKFGEAMHKVDIVVTKVNEQKTLDALHESVQNFDKVTSQMSGILHQLTADNVFDNLALVVNHARSASRNLDTITQNLTDADSTLGKLLNRDDLYLHVNEILSKAGTLLNDVNHYGLLFHLNKSWQRTRSHKMQVMDALKTPRDFRSFFEDEVEQINIAMTRLSILIEKAEGSNEQQMMDTPQFKKDFATLLRQIDELADNVKLYNQKLQEGN